MAVGLVVVLLRRRLSQASLLSSQVIWGRPHNRTNSAQRIVTEVIAAVVGGAFIVAGLLILVGVKHVW